MTLAIGFLSESWYAPWSWDIRGSRARYTRRWWFELVAAAALLLKTLLRVECYEQRCLMPSCVQRDIQG